MSGFSFNEVGVLEFLTYIAKRDRDWCVWASIPYIERGLRHRKIKSGAIKSALKLLRRHRVVTLTKKNHKDGNSYLVSPILLRRQDAETLKHYVEASLLSSGRIKKDRPARQKVQSDQKRPTERSKRSDQKKSNRRESDQKDPKAYSRSYRGEKRCPNGQDHKKTRKKDRREDAAERSNSESYFAKIAARALKKKKPVNKRENCNF